MSSKRLFAIVLLLLVPAAAAETLTEDFETFFTEVQVKPDQLWYGYHEGHNIGNVSGSSPISGVNSFLITSGTPTDASNRYGRFTLDVPAQLTGMDFTIQGTAGTEQYVAVESGSPVRKVVEFYVFCTDSANPTGCELRVRFQSVDSTGQVLVPYANLDQLFNIELTFDWITPEFCLVVDGVDDGCHAMLQVPRNVGRLSIHQFRPDLPMELRLDDWVVYGGVNASASPVDGDAAEGLRGFATDLKFTTSGSLFTFGLVLFIIMMAAVALPVFVLGKSNALGPALAFFGLLTVFWLIYMEFWPDWINILAIILVSGFIGVMLRKLSLGITNANSGPSLVAGSLGYFIICATFLAFAGYQVTSIEIPTGQVEPDIECPGVDCKTFGEEVVDCGLAIITLTLGGSCDVNEKSTTLATIQDVVTWGAAAVQYLFQLLTFQLPIPVIFNLMIVGPPAATLVAYAIEVIRGK